MRRPMNRIVFLTIICLCIASPLSARTFPDIVAFGDSLTDHEGAQSLIEPSEVDFIVPEAWTNCPESGPCVWVEYLADGWGATVDNYAIGGALTEGHVSEDVEDLVDLGILPPLGLVGQVDRYVDDGPEFDPGNTLFTVWIGGNDLLEFLRGDLDAATPEALVAGATGDIQQSMNELAGIGAQYILALSLPDLSQTPAWLDRTAEDRAAAQSLVRSFNAELENTLSAFEESKPGITVYRFDVFSFFNDTIQSGTFANTTGTLLVDPDNPFGGTNEPAEDYLFWDDIHPTTRTHELLGQSVAQILESQDAGGDPTDDNANDDDDDDDDTCFIAVAYGTTGSVPAWIGMLLSWISCAGAMAILRGRR